MHGSILVKKNLNNATEELTTAKLEINELKDIVQKLEVDKKLLQKDPNAERTEAYAEKAAHHIRINQTLSKELESAASKVADQQETISAYKSEIQQLRTKLDEVDEDPDTTHQIFKDALNNKIVDEAFMEQNFSKKFMAKAIVALQAQLNEELPTQLNEELPKSDNDMAE